MKRIWLLILTVLLLASCQTLPAIKSSVPEAAQRSFICPSPFLKEQYRLVHAIEVRMAGSTREAIIGITIADPATRFVSCAIMTAEGMVLFEAEAAPSLKVIRALPPFDKGDFAKNMIDDIKLIFFAPIGEIQVKGTLADGSTICRYREESGGWIDVIALLPEGIEINRYSTCGSLKRQIQLSQTAENIYPSIELTAKETLNYSLTMTLIEAVPTEGELNTEKTNGSDE
jgi:hypothetical protein